MLAHPLLKLLEDRNWSLYAADVLLIIARPRHLHDQVVVISPLNKLCRLSRFAYLRREGEQYILGSPVGNMSLTIHDPHVLLLLDQTQQAARLTASLEMLHILNGLLAAAGLLDYQDQDFEGWTFSDVVARFEHREDQPIRRPFPSLKPEMSEDVIKLSVSSILPDVSLVDTLESRRTVYDYGDIPVSLAALSDFLHLSASVSYFVEGVLYDSTRRPYPSSGATYALEIYILAKQCSGLQSGFYHYHPHSHSLEHLLLDVQGENVLINAAVQSTGGQTKSPHIILFITARIERIYWKRHALLLAEQDVGTLLQTFYLVATSLALAPCALGGLDADQFAHLTSIPKHKEPLLSGFLIGSSP